MLNFGAGPARLPQEVIQQLSQDILDYDQSGLSIAEIPHRGNAFGKILSEANMLVKKLMNLGEDYEVIWMQGGGRMQFALLPMNFSGADRTTGYLDSGHWASEAIRHARHYGNVSVPGSSREQHYTMLPGTNTIIPAGLAYLHITTNNTIYGTQYRNFPEGAVPLVADMSSDIFSRRLDFSQFDLIYAVAQKNLGIAGVTLVVVKKSFLKKANDLPAILSYREMAAKNSMVNTPPVFAIYSCLLTLRWIEKTGLDAIERNNRNKAALLYACLDESELFRGFVHPEHRSMMNVCFHMKDTTQTGYFLAYAASEGITGIKGHRSTGGFRVSLYNAITVPEVERLTALMRRYESIHGASGRPA